MSAAVRFRQAVSPLRRSFAPVTGALPTVDAYIAAERPEEPVHCIRSRLIEQTARGFLGAFPGNILYAVKCNPDPVVLRALHEGGVRHFDCASNQEMRVVRSMFPDAVIHFMHPVKARSAIREAWAQHGVRTFVLDSAEELAKIEGEVEATGVDGALALVVRLALPRGDAKLDLSGKFGADPEEAAALLRACRPLTGTLGVSFHVGSQCLDPLAWRRALDLTRGIIRSAGVTVEVVDVGGGFPATYPGQEPPELGAILAEIEEGFERLALPSGRLWAEPGRALVAAGASVVVQVQARKDNALYINDGVFGALSDAGALGFRYPVRLLRKNTSQRETPFIFYGPTCDSADVMHGPFVLPNDVREGDWIEIGQLGAYGASLRTSFNGFDRARIIEVSEETIPHVAGQIAV